MATRVKVVSRREIAKVAVEAVQKLIAEQTIEARAATDHRGLVAQVAQPHEVVVLAMQRHTAIVTEHPTGAMVLHEGEVVHRVALVAHVPIMVLVRVAAIEVQVPVVLVVHTAIDRAQVAATAEVFLHAVEAHLVAEVRVVVDVAADAVS